MKIDEFRRRDYRIKCATCGLWMQKVPRAKGVTRTRRESPHASQCTMCPPSAGSVQSCKAHGGCSQCRGLTVKLGRVLGVRLVPRDPAAQGGAA